MVITHNLAIGDVVGSITAMVIFAKRVAHLAEVTAATDRDGTTVVHRVTGELFFASSNDLIGRLRVAYGRVRLPGGGGSQPGSYRGLTTACGV